jgi:hypothetical protein
MFEGHWACTAHCLETLIGTAVRRESGDHEVVQPEGEHRHRVPLGLILLAQGSITHLQLQHALERQRRAGVGRIGQWLTEECGLDPACVIRGLSAQWGCPVVPLDEFDPVAMALAAPRILVEQLGVLPVRIAGRRILYLAFADRLDASIAFAMERMSGLKVESGLVDEVRWRLAHQRLYGCDLAAAALEQVVNLEAMSGRMASAIAKLQPRASRLVRVHQFYWLRMWLESGAMKDPGGSVPATKEDVVDRLYCVGLNQ